LSAEIARLRSQLEKGEVVKQSVEYELMKVRKELATERQLRIQHATESSKTIEDLQRMLNVIDEQVRLHGIAGNCVLKFPGPGKSWKIRLVLEIYVQGPGKSWSLLCGDADGGRNDADADAKICASAHLSSVFEQFF